MWEAIGNLVSGAASKKSGSSGSGGLGYSGQNSSSIYTPVESTAGGGIGSMSFDLANKYSKGVNQYLLIGAALLVAYMVLRK